MSYLELFKQARAKLLASQGGRLEGELREERPKHLKEETGWTAKKEKNEEEPGKGTAIDLHQLAHARLGRAAVPMPPGTAAVLGRQAQGAAAAPDQFAVTVVSLTA